MTLSAPYRIVWISKLTFSRAPFIRAKTSSGKASSNLFRPTACSNPMTSRAARVVPSVASVRNRPSVRWGTYGDGSAAGVAWTLLELARGGRDRRIRWRSAGDSNSPFGAFPRLSGLDSRCPPSKLESERPLPTLAPEAHAAVRARGGEWCTVDRGRRVSRPDRTTPRAP